MLALTFFGRRFCSGTCHDIDVECVLLADWAFSFSRNFSGNFCVRTDKKRAGAHTEDMQNAQELLVGNALEYIKRNFCSTHIWKRKRRKRKSRIKPLKISVAANIAVTISTAGIMKLYEAVF